MAPSLLGGWGTAVTSFLSFRARLTKILHCQHANPELARHMEHGDDKHVPDATNTNNNNTMTSTGTGGGSCYLVHSEVNTEAGMTGNMPAPLSP